MREENADLFSFPFPLEVVVKGDCVVRYYKPRAVKEKANILANNLPSPEVCYT